MQRQKKGKSDECVICFGPWTVFMRLSESGLCIEEGWSITYPQLGQFHPTNLFLSLNLWCKDLARQKRGKGFEVSILNVLAPGLSLCADQKVDFVQEMVD